MDVTDWPAEQQQSSGQRPSPPLRIAMVVPPWYELPPRGYGGLEQVCTALVDGLAGRGHKVTLFGAGNTFAAANQPATISTAASFVGTVAEPQYQRIGQALPELLHVARVDQMITDDAFDIVHDHTMVGLLSAGRRPVPTIATVHGCPTGELGDYLSCLGSGVSLVAISRAQRRLHPTLPWVSVIHHGLAATEPGRRSSSTGPVLWLARFSADKGPDLAIHACRAAGLPLVLAGKCNEPDEHRYLNDVIRPLLGPDVTLILDPDRPSCRALLLSARCLLLPIRWEEPFGMVMIEAMAVGTPVVALGRGAVPEVVRHGVTGLICDEPTQLPEALRDVVTLDPQACVRHVRGSFSVDAMVRRYEHVYRNHLRTGLPA
jgi:glycosyltransferase involved in cell wall biosynthesis